MKVYCNDQSIDFAHQDVVLTQLLEKMDLHQANGIAVAVNQQVVAKSQWHAHLLKDQDKVLIIKAT